VSGAGRLLASSRVWIARFTSQRGDEEEVPEEACVWPGLDDDHPRGLDAAFWGDLHVRLNFSLFRHAQLGPGSRMSGTAQTSVTPKQAGVSERYLLEQRRPGRLSGRRGLVLAIEESLSPAVEEEFPAHCIGCCDLGGRVDGLGKILGDRWCLATLPRARLQ
jgi:hypothetical protein